MGIVMQKAGAAAIIGLFSAGILLAGEPARAAGGNAKVKKDGGG